jgi:hypothetical protein
MKQDDLTMRFSFYDDDLAPAIGEPPYDEHVWLDAGSLTDALWRYRT